MQRIDIIGHLSHDPEVKNISAKRSVINFTTVVNSRWTDGNGQRHDKATYYDCSYWRDSESVEKVAKLLKKGMQVYVNGDPSTRAFMKSSGEPNSVIKIEVAQLDILSPLNKPENS